ncbi:MAG TPA: MFS transporter [Chloroflexota bacterium]|nr:MFS transporter [Chloroflexota bacterium]
MGLARSSGGGPLVLALMCLISLNLRSVSVGVSPVLPLVRADFAVSYALAGVLFALPIAMMGLWAEPGRRLVDRWGPWRAIALSLALLVTGGGLRALAPNYWTMLALTALFGAGIGLAQPSLPRLVAQRFPTRRAFATGVYSAGLTGGAVLGASVTALLLPSLGALSWRGTCLLWAAFAALSLTAWLALGPRGPVAQSTPGVAQPDPGAPPRPSGVGSPTVRPAPIWRDRVAWLITVLFLLQSMGFYQLVGWLPSYYQELGLSLEAASVPFTVLNLASLPCGLLASYLSDRVRRRRPFVATGALMLLAGMAGLLLSPLHPAWLWTALAGGGIGIVFTIALALPTDLLDPRRAGPTVSLVFTVGYGAALVSPLLAGALRDALGSFTLALLPTVATGFGMLAANLALPETARGLHGPTSR